MTTQRSDRQAATIEKELIELTSLKRGELAQGTWVQHLVVHALGMDQDTIDMMTDVTYDFCNEVADLLEAGKPVINFFGVVPPPEEEYLEDIPDAEEEEVAKLDDSPEDPESDDSPEDPESDDSPEDPESDDSPEDPESDDSLEDPEVEEPVAESGPEPYPAPIIGDDAATLEKVLKQVSEPKVPRKRSKSKIKTVKGRSKSPKVRIKPVSKRAASANNKGISPFNGDEVCLHDAYRDLVLLNLNKTRAELLKMGQESDLDISYHSMSTCIYHVQEVLGALNVIYAYEPPMQIKLKSNRLEIARVTAEKRNRMKVIV